MNNKRTPFYETERWRMFEACVVGVGVVTVSFIFVYVMHNPDIYFRETRQMPVVPYTDGTDIYDWTARREEIERENKQIKESRLLTRLWRQVFGQE